jgi:hypothetical protein
MIMLNVRMLNVVALNVIMTSVVVLSVSMLSDVILSVVVQPVSVPRLDNMGPGYVFKPSFCDKSQKNASNQTTTEAREKNACIWNPHNFRNFLVYV